MLYAASGSLLLAYFSWRFIEQPLRDQKRVSNRVFYPVLGVITCLFFGLGVYLHLSKGRLNRCPELAAEMDYTQYTDSARRFKSNVFTQSPNEKILVVGNSFARDFLNCGVECNAFKGKEIVYVEEESANRFADIVITEELGALLTAADKVVVSFDFGLLHISRIKLGVEKLQNHTAARVCILGCKNFGWNNNAVMLLPTSERYKYRTKILHEVIAANEKAKNVFGEKYIDVLSLMDNGDGRVPVFSNDRKFLSQDRQHLTQAGALYVGNLIFRHYRFWNN